MRRGGSRFSGLIGAYGMLVLAGCGDFKQNVAAADQRLQAFFGTAPRSQPVQEAAGAPEPAPVPESRPAPPDPLQQATADWNAGRFERAVSRLRPLGETGNPEAQYRMGLAHAQGRGVARDPVAALAWWHKAGIQGHANAQYQLGEAYLQGRGVEEDPGLASAWLARASAREHAAATYRLSLLYEARARTAIDEAHRRAALVLLERAAEQGHPEAQLRIAEAYADGVGVDRDPAWAARWFGKAARQGVAQAQVRLAHAFASGNGVPQDVPRAAAWYARAAAAGHPGAADALASLEQGLDAAQREEANRLAGRLEMQAAGSGFTDPATVLYVQSALAERGHDAGAPDGLFGPNTRQALTEWQRASGLQPDGTIGPRVLAALRGVDDDPASPDLPSTDPTDAVAER